MNIDYTAVVATRDRNPCATLRDIGDKYGITKQCVHQILKKRGVPTIGISKTKLERICPLCGKDKGPRGRICIKCRRAEWKNRLIPLVCDGCGVLFERHQYLVIRYNKLEECRGHVFCGKSCFHAWETGRLHPRREE